MLDAELFGPPLDIDMDVDIELELELVVAPYGGLIGPIGDPEEANESDDDDGTLELRELLGVGEP